MHFSLTATDMQQRPLPCMSAVDTLPHLNALQPYNTVFCVYPLLPVDLLGTSMHFYPGSLLFSHTSAVPLYTIPF